MQRAAGTLQQRAAPREIDRVVAVAPVGGAATRAHELAGAELAEVIGDEALALADQLRELTNRAVAADELTEQVPPDRVRNEREDRGWVDGARRQDRCELHAGSLAHRRHNRTS